MLPKNNPLRAGLKAIDDVLQNIVKTAKAAGDALKSIPGVKQILGFRKKLLDPRSGKQIAQSNERRRRMLAAPRDESGRITGIEGGPLTKMAEGGLVQKATVALVGEEGAEAVIPLTTKVLSQIGEGASKGIQVDKSRGDTVINVNLGDINITGDNQDSASIKRMMERELPKIISRSVRSGASGVI